LELGSGPFSTGLFLNQRVFPSLERLESYEDDPSWAAIVLDQVGNDSRLDLRQVADVTDAVPLRIEEFDLVFIDDSQTSPERAETISRVAAIRPQSLVVIHDFETRAYRREARKFDNCLVSDTFTPQVGLVWNDRKTDREPLKRAITAVASGANLGVRDIDGWLGHLARALPGD
jgi:hypothetical protein